MSFEEEDLDQAYKLLESTEKFCDPSRGFSLSRNLSQRHSQHERLYRRSIIADCLLFEAVIVFLKQGFTSYVKGSYILRKAWKQYEKLYNEVEQICVTPCPISVAGTTSVDSHIGTSLYDKPSSQEEEIMTDGAADPFTGSLHGLLGFDETVEDAVEKELSEKMEAIDRDDCNDEYVCTTDDDIDSTVPLPTDNGYSLPEVPDSVIQSLDDQDSRLRGGLYFGYGLMNVIVSLIPPKLMKVANLLGFRGSRKVGLQALEYSSHSQDMKAPLARYFVR